MNIGRGAEEQDGRVWGVLRVRERQKRRVHVEDTVEEPWMWQELHDGSRGDVTVSQLGIIV